jgi:hypothetical protein
MNLYDANDLLDMTSLVRDPMHDLSLRIVTCNMVIDVLVEHWPHSFMLNMYEGVLIELMAEQAAQEVLTVLSKP